MNFLKNKSKSTKNLHKCIIYNTEPMLIPNNSTIKQEQSNKGLFVLRLRNYQGDNEKN